MRANCAEQTCKRQQAKRKDAAPEEQSDCDREGNCRHRRPQGGEKPQVWVVGQDKLVLSAPEGERLPPTHRNRRQQQTLPRGKNHDSMIAQSPRHLQVVENCAFPVAPDIDLLEDCAGHDHRAAPAGIGDIGDTQQRRNRGIGRRDDGRTQPVVCGDHPAIAGYSRTVGVDDAGDEPRQPKRLGQRICISERDNLVGGGEPTERGQKVMDFLPASMRQACDYYLYRGSRGPDLLLKCAKRRIVFRFHRRDDAVVRIVLMPNSVEKRLCGLRCAFHGDDHGHRGRRLWNLCERQPPSIAPHDQRGADHDHQPRNQQELSRHGSASGVAITGEPAKFDGPEMWPLCNAPKSNAFFAKYGHADIFPAALPL